MGLLLLLLRSGDDKSERIGEPLRLDDSNSSSSVVVGLNAPPNQAEYPVLASSSPIPVFHGRSPASTPAVPFICFYRGEGPGGWPSRSAVERGGLSRIL